MASSVGHALRVMAEARDKLTCHRERMFTEMFQSLGEFETHEQLRMATPHLPHCYLLKQSAHACIRLPVDLSDDGAGPRQGDVCPNNPFEKPQNAALIERVSRFHGIASRATELVRMQKTGFLSAGMITSAEFEAIHAVEAFGNIFQREEYERLADEAKRKGRG